MSDVDLITLFRIYQLSSKQIEKGFVLLEDENISRKTKVLFCEYVVGLHQLKNLLQAYAESTVNPEMPKVKAGLVKDMVGMCADLEQEVLDTGFSLEIH